MSRDGLHTLLCNLHTTPEPPTGKTATPAPLLFGSKREITLACVASYATFLHLHRISDGKPSSGCGYISGRNSCGVTCQSTDLQALITCLSGMPLAFVFNQFHTWACLIGLSLVDKTSASACCLPPNKSIIFTSEEFINDTIQE